MKTTCVAILVALAVSVVYGSTYMQLDCMDDQGVDHENGESFHVNKCDSCDCEVIGEMKTAFCSSQPAGHPVFDDDSGCEAIWNEDACDFDIISLNGNDCEPTGFVG